MPSYAKNIFCIEGYWDGHMRSKKTVAPVMELLGKMDKQINHVHATCATVEEFEFYLKEWTRPSYKYYGILYLAFHGVENALCIGNNVYSLEQMAELLQGKGENAYIIFGACSTMKGISKRTMKQFLAITGAKAVCGYADDVDWLRATAFELLLLGLMQENSNTMNGVRAFAKKAKSLARSFKDLKPCIYIREA